jgi:hypothetical protein
MLSSAITIVYCVDAGFELAVIAALANIKSPVSTVTVVSLNVMSPSEVTTK